MNQPLADQSPPKIEEATQRAIWLPNPAVPLTARILAYVFGVLMLLTIIKSCTGDRPPDAVEFPRSWQSVRSAQGMILPIPAGWRSEDRSKNGYTDIAICLPPGDWVNLEAVMIESPYPVDSTMLAQLNEKFEGNLQKEYKNYTPQMDGQAVTGWHMFQADLPNRDAAQQSVVGAWGARTQDQRILYLVASSPQGSWKNMQRILSYMLANAILRSK